MKQHMAPRRCEDQSSSTKHATESRPHRAAALSSKTHHSHLANTQCLSEAIERTAKPKPKARVHSSDLRWRPCHLTATPERSFS